MTAMADARITVAAVLLAATATSCAAQTSNSGAPPLAVCGTTLWKGASGAIITDATTHDVTIIELTSGDAIYLRLSKDCSHGSSISVSANQATKGVVARSHDGNIAAVQLFPRATTFTVVAHHWRATDTTTLVCLANPRPGVRSC